MAKVMIAKEYFEVSNASDIARKDRNNCVLKAFVLWTGLYYDEVYEAFRVAGRRHGCATYQWQASKAAKALGYDLVIDGFLPSIIRKAYPENFGPKNITIGHIRHARLNEAFKPHGKMMLYVSGHIAFYDGEKVVDWSVNGSRRIVEIWFLNKIGE